MPVARTGPFRHPPETGLLACPVSPTDDVCLPWAPVPSEPRRFRRIPDGPTSCARRRPARGYVLRAGPPEDLFRAVRSAAEGGSGLALYLAEATVKTHLVRIYRKLGVDNKAAAVAEAVRRVLLELT